MFSISIKVSLLAAVSTSMRFSYKPFRNIKIVFVDIFQAIYKEDKA